MNKGEDVQGLRRIMDFSRIISVFVLSVHFYLSCYGAFVSWGLQAWIPDRINGNLFKLSWLNGIWKPKVDLKARSMRNS